MVVSSNVGRAMWQIASDDVKFMGNTTLVYTFDKTMLYNTC